MKGVHSKSPSRGYFSDMGRSICMYMQSISNHTTQHSFIRRVRRKLNAKNDGDHSENNDNDEETNPSFFAGSPS